jgi:hypothetical protein
MPQTLAQRQKLYRERHPEKIAAYKPRLAVVSKVWRDTNKEQIKNSKLLRTYGIGLKEYNYLLEVQGGTCALCPSDDPGAGREYFSVDHDHVTGKVRGLLCSKCNVALERLDTIVGWAEKATSYREGV